MNNINEKRKYAAPLELLLEFGSALDFFRAPQETDFANMNVPANVRLITRCWVAPRFDFWTEFTEFVQ